MKADLTRSTDRPEQHYRSVRLQQGRVQLDAEWNEQQDILNRRIEAETLDTLGAGAAAPVDNAGFLLTGAGQNVSIGAGRCYVQGLLCEAGTGLSVVAQPGFAPAVSPVVPLALPPAGAAPLAAIRVYDAAGAAVAPADGLYIGFVEAWLRHVTALEDPLIREVALGLPDTSTRDQLVWQVKLLRAGALGDALSCITEEPWKTFASPPDGRFAARAEPSVPPKDPCLLTPEAGYRRLENQLYRVEIHDDGSVSGKQRYKWSRDNGSIATRVTRWLGEPAADEFEVASIGRDAVLAITGGCWVEFYDDTHDQLGLPGTLVQVLKTAGNVVTIDLASKTGPLDKALFSANPRVRRWEGWAQMTPVAAANAAGWVALEDGIEVKFTPGRYRIGDFWTVPARTATADIEWPRDDADKPLFAAPQGPLRALARLAVLRCQAGVWTTLADCRQLFPALSELTNLHYVGGDGQAVMPNPLAPANIPLPQKLKVAVFNGQFPVAGAQVQFTASHGALPNGALVDQATTGADGVAEIAWAIAPAVASQTCRAVLLQAGQPAPGKFQRIDFSASTLTAAQVSYDPAKCPNAQAAGITTVQGALDALCQAGGRGGCCATVGPGGDFGALDVAIKALLERGERDLCLCLLPGRHEHKGAIGVAAPPGTHLHVHGAGAASRLVLPKSPFALRDFASVSLEDFDVHWTQDWALLRLDNCTRVRLARLALAGLTPRGSSLLQVAGAVQFEVSGCRIDAFAGEPLKAHLDGLFKAAPLLQPLQRAFEVGDGSVFVPIDPKLVEQYAGLGSAQRKDLLAQITELLRAGQTGALVLGEEEAAGLQALGTDLRAQASAAVLARTLERWRTGVLLSGGGAAIALLDAEAETLLADNRLNGHLSLYGDFKELRPDDALFKNLGAALKAGKLSLAAGPGLLRLRNNRLRGVRCGDETIKRIAELAQKGGVLDGCYRSLVADANTLSVESADLLAIDASLGTTVFELRSDVGSVVARQGKYLGNFADNDFRLFAAGHTAEKFGNGMLNIVQL